MFLFAVPCAPQYQPLRGAKTKRWVLTISEGGETRLSARSALASRRM